MLPKRVPTLTLICMIDSLLVDLDLMRVRFRMSAEHPECAGGTRRQRGHWTLDSAPLHSVSSPFTQHGRERPTEDD